MEGKTEKTPEGAPGSGAGEQILDALHNVLWAGMGLVAVTAEQSERIVKTLVDKGREVEPSVREQSKKAAESINQAMKGVAESIGRGAGKAEVAFDDKINAALRRMGFPTKEDVRSLAEKIDSLTTKIEQLQSRG